MKNRTVKPESADITWRQFFKRLFCWHYYREAEATDDCYTLRCPKCGTFFEFRHLGHYEDAK
jgi:hypothetical protein